ncbi:MAG: cation:proton antiporter [Cyanobacteria bacterium P01_D01_bin.73]
MAAAAEGLILDFVTVLGTSAVGGYIANRCRQPALLGYIVSGALVGPFGFELLTDVGEIQGLAELGVAFLLFALGVEFSISEIRRIKGVAIQGSLLQIGLTAGLTAGITVALGWATGVSEAIFLGAALSLSSTAVVLKTLTERGETGTLHGQIALAMLIVQDLALGVMLAMLPALNQPENLVTALAIAVLKAGLFLVVAIGVGRWFMPRLMNVIAATESSELLLLSTIALCLGVALITQALGLSIEMGAFIAGLTISGSERADQALSKILPLRDTFASLFFASIGMLIDPQVLLDNAGVVLGLVALVMMGKALIIFPIVLRFGYSFKTAFLTGFGINQIGEFSFVLALQGKTLGLIDERPYLLLLGTTAITLVLTPILFSVAPEIADRLEHNPFVMRWLRRFEEPKELKLTDTIKDHVVVAGFGRVGRVIVAILQQQGYPVLVLENSEAAVRKLRSDKLPFIYGDAHSELVLEKAHLEKAKALAIALPDPASTRLLLRHARQMCPDLEIIARVHDNKELDMLVRMGAAEVVQPEFEAALELSTHLLAQLGNPETEIHDLIEQIRINRYISVRSELPERIKTLT